MVCGLGLFWWWGRPGEVQAVRPQGVSVGAPLVPSPPALVSIAELPPRDELPEPVRRYLDETVYPPDSGRLDRAGDLLDANPRYERFKPVPGSFGAVPPLEFLWTANAFRYTSGEEVVARFEARGGEAPARVRTLEAWAQAEGRGGRVGERRTLVLRREGERWVGRLALSRDFDDHLGFVVLGVRYAVEDLAPQEEQIRIFVTPEGEVPGRFTGTFRDRVREGSLEVEAGVEIEEEGFYRFDASLYGPGGEPVAWAAFKGELSTRDGVVPLRFFGKVLYDLGVAGPYELRMLRGYRFRDGEFPDRVHLKDFEGVFVTRGFELADFSNAEWDGEHRQRMVELLLQDEAAGISLDMPELARGDGSQAPPSLPSPTVLP